MKIAASYHLRSTLLRWRSTASTGAAIALVVAVFVVVQSLATGLESASISTGDPSNALVVRRGATAESTSQITPEQFRLIRYAPEIARDPVPLASADLVVVINLPRRSGGEANASVRGISPQGARLRPGVELREGRWFIPGRREVVVSQRLAARFANLGIGETFRSGPAELTVAGHFDAGGTAFDSEIWIDADEARSLFDRENYSSLLARMTEEGAFAAFARRLEEDKRFRLRVVRESDYYAEQTKAAIPIRVLGGFLAVTMSVGAVFAAMNAMYAAIGARTREIGTLRVLGFRRSGILCGFLLEGAILGLVGGVAGCLLALPMNGYSTGTVSFESFSEAVFAFRITPRLLAEGLLFAVAVGIAGSLLPALRAARIPTIAALRSP